MRRVHQADPELDAITGPRFHPLDILLSMGLMMAAVVAFGAPAAAVLAFEVLMNATATFNHAAIRLPARLEPWLRRFVVTPEMRRTHQPEARAGTDSCYGFCLPWWERLPRGAGGGRRGGGDRRPGLARRGTAAARPVAFPARAVGAVRARKEAAVKNTGRDVRRTGRAMASRPIPVLAALGIALAGCGADAGPGRYYGGGYYGGGGGYYGGPGYYGSPYPYGGYGRPYGGYDRFYGSRRQYGGGAAGPMPAPPPPRAGSPPQDRLGQFWRGELPKGQPPQDRLGQFWRGELPRGR